MNDKALERVRRQFLPAALELQETPPSPAGRRLLWLLLALFAAGILWASVGEVDIVVSAPGRIVPGGRVKVVQAPVSGTVTAILAREGERVEAGQVLVRLDPTRADAEVQRVREQLHDLAMQSAWRLALERWLADGRDAAAAETLPVRFAAADQRRVEALFRQHRAEIAARLRGLDKELAANRAEQAALRAEQDRAHATLAVLQERVAAHKVLLDRQYGAKVQYLAMLQQQTELERTVPVLASRQRQLSERAAALAADADATASEFRRRNLVALAGLDVERGGLEQSLRAARLLLRQHALSAPVTGTVHELAVHTVGAVLAPAQQLMKIVPEDDNVEVEALVRNRDIGFVNRGQQAGVKIDTFNFTRYGLVAAEVADIGNDAIEDPRLGWVFSLRLKLAQDQIAVDDRMVALSPGMAVTAEITTGRRRLMEFFLSPLLRYRQESVRER